MKLANILKLGIATGILLATFPDLSNAYPIKWAGHDLVVSRDDVRKRKIILGNNEYSVERTETPKVNSGDNGERFLVFEYEDKISSGSSEIFTNEKRKKIEFATNVLWFIEKFDCYLDHVKDKKRELSDYLIEFAINDQKENKNSGYSSEPSYEPSYESSYYNNKLSSLYLEKKRIRTEYDINIKTLELGIERIDKELEHLRPLGGAKTLEEIANVLKGIKGKGVWEGIKDYGGSEQSYLEAIERLEKEKENKEREIDNLYEFKKLDLSKIEQQEGYIEKQLELEKQRINQETKQEKNIPETIPEQTNPEQFGSKEQIELELYRSVKKTKQLVNPTFEDFIYSMPKNPSLKKSNCIYPLLYSSYLIASLEQELKKYNIYIKEKNGIKTMSYEDALKINDQANIFGAKINYLNHLFRIESFLSSKTWHSFFSNYKKSMEARFKNYFWNNPENMKVDVPE